MMKRTIEKIDEEIKICDEKVFPDPEPPQTPRYRKNRFFSTVLIGSPIADFIVDKIIYDVEDIDSFVLRIIAILFLVTLLICLFPLNALIGLVIYFGNKSKVEIYNEEKEKEYLNAQKEYKEQCKKCAEQAADNRKTIDNLKVMKESLRIQHNESEKKLNEFYEKININKKFRGILPISYMAEFIELGIATKLEGADGLYYLVLKEIKDTEFKYTLTAKLDEVVQKEQQLHSQLEKIKRSCDVMFMNTINQASVNTISDYQNERIAKELEYQTYLMKKYL